MSTLKAEPHEVEPYALTAFAPLVPLNLFGVDEKANPDMRKAYVEGANVMDAFVKRIQSSWGV